MILRSPARTGGGRHNHQLHSSLQHHIQHRLYNYWPLLLILVSYVYFFFLVDVTVNRSWFHFARQRIGEQHSFSPEVTRPTNPPPSETPPTTAHVIELPNSPPTGITATNTSADVGALDAGATSGVTRPKLHQGSLSLQTDILEHDWWKDYEDLVDVIKPRAYEPRAFEDFPCFLEDPKTKWWRQGSSSSKNNTNNTLSNSSSINHNLTHLTFSPAAVPSSAPTSAPTTPVTEGFFFLKTHKTGSSTGAGIHLRIARNLAAKKQLELDLLYRNSTNATSYNTTEHDTDNTDSMSLELINHTMTGNTTTNSTATTSLKKKKQNIPMCRVRFDHSSARKMNYGRRSRENSFLWTIVREPTERAISQFFHFEVSRKNANVTEGSMESFLLSNRAHTNSYYLRMLSFRDAKNGKYQKSRVQEVVDKYDFIAITERMDESAVALQMLLGLSLADVLFLNAKESGGGYDAGGYQGKCTYIQEKNVTDEMITFLQTSKAWKSRVYWDRVLYRAANQSLDLTIDRLGRTAFENSLQLFRRAQEMAKEQCVHGTGGGGNNTTNATKVVFPCSASQNDKPPLRYNETDCLWKDSACGSECLDRVATQLGLWPEQQKQ